MHRLKFSDDNETNIIYRKRSGCRISFFYLRKKKHIVQLLFHIRALERKKNSYKELTHQPSPH